MSSPFEVIEFDRPGKHQWTIPPGKKRIKAYLYGGGGGGGPRDQEGGEGGGGGSGYYQYSSNLATRPRGTLKIVVGKGGAPGRRGEKSQIQLNRSVLLTASGGFPGKPGLLSGSGGDGGAGEFGGDGGNSSNSKSLPGVGGKGSRGENGKMGVTQLSKEGGKGGGNFAQGGNGAGTNKIATSGNSGRVYLAIFH